MSHFDAVDLLKKAVVKIQKLKQKLKTTKRQKRFYELRLKTLWLFE